MSLTNLLLAVALSFTPTKECPEVNQVCEPDAESSFDARPRRLPQLRIRTGQSYIDGSNHTGFGIAVAFDKGIFFEIAVNTERDRRVKQDKLTIKGIGIEGLTKSRRHEAGINLGYDFQRFRVERGYLRVIPAVSAVAGIDFEIEKLYPEEGGSKIPRDLELDSFLGIGPRVNFMYPLAHGIDVPVLRELEIGGGGLVEYRRRGWKSIIDNKGHMYDLEAFFVLTYTPEPEGYSVSSALAKL
jgi:hypothetical protein